MSNWTFDTNEVLTDKDGKWWHVRHRRVCVDCDTREYALADATHTAYQTMHADDVEGWDGYDGVFDSQGWATNTKPASVHGFRVNGVLCGPEAVDHHKGKACLHERTCPECGADGNEEIDILHSYEERELQWTQMECRECEHVWSGDDE